MIHSDQARPFGPYLLVRRLAAGGMAEVYLAKIRGAAGFEKPVAIKRIHAQSSAGDGAQDMLVQEAKLSVLLCHPNIVQTLDLAFVEGSWVIVMEHVEGSDLQRVLDGLEAADRLFPVDLAAHITAEICDALDYAHRALDPQGKPAGVVHRDVSPQNVLLSRAGEVKIADFGIAKTQWRQSNPEGSVLKGKYFYMSPEQAWAESVDQRSDIFSTGVVLWELLVGRRLHQAVDIASLLHAVRRAEVPPPSGLRAEVPTGLDAIVARATASDRQKRYPDAASMARALRAYLTSRPSIHPARQIGELLASLPADERFAAQFDSSNVPQTRDRVVTLAAPQASTPPNHPLRYSLEDGEPTVAGRRSPEVVGTHRCAWLLAVAVGFGVVGLVLWWLHGS
jgi:serine/threonine protein kinase